jgi:predicted flap endonuclease-1-like 5' DNA nuclease
MPQESPVEGFEVASMYEEVGEDVSDDEVDDEDDDLTQVKGIGQGTAESLKDAGITSIRGLIGANPDDIASKVSGASPNKVKEWQSSARGLVQT